MKTLTRLNCCFAVPMARVMSSLSTRLWRLKQGQRRGFSQFYVALGIQSDIWDPQLEHILISGFFSGFFEIVVHDMPLERAYDYVRELRDFYLAGWRKIIGL